MLEVQQVINTITSLQQTFRQLQFCFLYSILYVRLYQSSRQQQIVNRHDNSSQFPWNCFVQMVLRVEFYVCMFLVVPSSNQMPPSVRNCSESDILITLFFYIMYCFYVYKYPSVTKLYCCQHTPVFNCLFIALQNFQNSNHIKPYTQNKYEIYYSFIVYNAILYNI